MLAALCSKCGNLIEVVGVVVRSSLCSENERHLDLAKITHYLQGPCVSGVVQWQ